MSISRLNPDSPHATPGYHHITVVERAHRLPGGGSVRSTQPGWLQGVGDFDARVDQVAANTRPRSAAVVLRRQRCVALAQGCRVTWSWKKECRASSRPPRAAAWLALRAWTNSNSTEGGVGGDDSAGSGAALPSG